MVKISSITALGIFIIILASPFIAIPRSWKDYLFVGAGMAILILSLLIRRELTKVIRLVHKAHEIKSDTYVENNPQ